MAEPDPEYMALFHQVTALLEVSDEEVQPLIDAQSNNPDIAERTEKAVALARYMLQFPWSDWIPFMMRDKRWLEREHPVVYAADQYLRAIRQEIPKDTDDEELGRLRKLTILVDIICLFYEGMIAVDRTVKSLPQGWPFAHPAVTL